MTAALLTQHDPAEVLADTNTEALIRHAHLLLAEWRITVGIAKVSRIVRKYKDEVERNGYAFDAYLANAACVGQAISTGELDANRRRSNYHSDPVGNIASRNVDAERGGV